jgi:hypothetical protein
VEEYAKQETSVKADGKQSIENVKDVMFQQSRLSTKGRRTNRALSLAAVVGCAKKQADLRTQKTGSLQ